MISLLNRVDSLFLESGISIKHISVKVVRGVGTTDLEFPTASFVSTGFCVVFLHTNIGLIGIGEPSPYGGSIAETIDEIGKLNLELKGKLLYDAWIYPKFCIEELNSIYGSLARQAVIASVSQCCMDILGKFLSMPCYKILQPESDGKIPAYASGGMIYDDQSLDICVDEALECKENGYNAWKFRPSTPRGLDHFQRSSNPPPIDVKAITYIVDKVQNESNSKIEILLDIGCRCKDITQAKYLCDFSSEYNVGFIEEPLPRDVKMYSELVRATNVNISIGETFSMSEQFSIWAQNGAVDIFQPDANLVGMREAIKVFDIALKHGKQIVPHNWSNSIAIAANLHLSVAMKDVCKYVESSIIYNPFLLSLPTVPLLPFNGEFNLSDRSDYGLGIEINNLI